MRGIADFEKMLDLKFLNIFEVLIGIFYLLIPKKHILKVFQFLKLHHNLKIRNVVNYNSDIMKINFLFCFGYFADFSFF